MKVIIHIFPALLAGFACLTEAGVSAQNAGSIFSYDISYLRKPSRQKVRHPERDQGSHETIYLENGNFRAVRTCGQDTLGNVLYQAQEKATYFRPRHAAFTLVSATSPDSALPVRKLDSLVRIGDYQTGVYKCKTETSLLTFYIMKEEGNVPFYYYTWYHLFGPFSGPVVRLKIENKDFVSVQTLVAREEKALPRGVFDPGSGMKVTPPNQVTSQVLPPLSEKAVQGCISKNLGYPVFMQLGSLEGKATLDLVIDKSGKLAGMYLEPDFFRVIGKNNRITNQHRIDRIAGRIMKRLNNSCIACLSEVPLNAPLAGKLPVNTLLKVPLAFSRAGNDYYSDRDEYFDYEDYYDYYDFYDYRD